MAELLGDAAQFDHRLDEGRDIRALSRSHSGVRRAKTRSIDTATRRIAPSTRP